MLFCAIVASPAAAEGEGKWAATAQNPLASMISLPLQNNTTLGLPEDDYLNLLNIQPVYPVRLSESLNLITRTLGPAGF